VGENKELLRKYLKKWGMENLLHTLRELLDDEDDSPETVFLARLKTNLENTTEEYLNRHHTVCQYCDEYKINQKCNECLNFTCLRCGPYCCKCGENYYDHD
jgi:hypothetical protein